MHSHGQHPSATATTLLAKNLLVLLGVLMLHPMRRHCGDTQILNSFCRATALPYGRVLSRPQSLLRKPTKVSGCWILLVHRLPLHHHLIRKPVEQFCRERQRCHSAHALNINNLDTLDTKQPWQVCLQFITQGVIITDGNVSNEQRAGQWAASALLCLEQG